MLDLAGDLLLVLLHPSDRRVQLGDLRDVKQLARRGCGG
jgi:hypothetical protein